MAHIVVLASKLAPNIKALNPDATHNTHLYAQQGTYLKMDRRSKQFITGYNLPYGVTDERVLESKEGDPLYDYKPIVEERLYLEKALSVSLTGGLENEYLKNLYIVTKTKNQVEVSFDLHDPEDLFKYRALLANGVAAESLEGTRGSRFDYQFYFKDPQTNEKRKKKLVKIKNRIKGKLSENEENKVWLFSVAKKLDLPVGYDASPDSLYVVISESVDKETAERKLESIEKFVSQPLKDIEFFLVWYIGIITLAVTTNEHKQKVANGKVIGITEEEAKQNLQTSSKYKEVYDYLREITYKKLKLI